MSPAPTPTLPRAMRKGGSSVANSSVTLVLVENTHAFLFCSHREIFSPPMRVARGRVSGETRLSESMRSACRTSVRCISPLPCLRGRVRVGAINTKARGLEIPGSALIEAEEVIR